MPSPFLAVVHRAARGRRAWLLGQHGPWLARFRPPDLPTVDRAEHGEAAVVAWAFWKESEAIDAGLAALAGARVARGAEALSPPQALWTIASEPDRDASAGLTSALARGIAQPARMLASAFAAAADRAGDRGLSALVAAEDASAARALLDATAEPVRDVLDWATLRAGRPRRKRPAFADVLAVLRAAALDDLVPPAGDPWPALRRWREKWGHPLEAETERGPGDGWFGSWALRGRERRVVGCGGWPGLLGLRYALEGLGKLDALVEAGRPLLLPCDPAAAQLLSALAPGWLGEQLFQRRALGSRTANADTGRLATLNEVLLHRLQAALVLLWSTFDGAREVAAVLDRASLVGEALGVSVPSELALLFAVPWPLSLAAGPRAVLASAALAGALREAFDVDYWRNPGVVPRVRELCSRAAEATLGELVPGELPDWVRAYRSSVEARLGA